MGVADKRKIAIVGTGAVGTTIAYAVMMSGLATELVLVDIDRNKALGEAMDLVHGLSFVQPVHIFAGEYEDCRDADIIVYTAGVNQKEGETRLDLVNKNLSILKQCLPKIMDKNSQAILLMVANPVDILTYAALRIGGLSPYQVMGSGTVLDTSRFRYIISRWCHVEARNIHAYVIGEHGDSEVFLWSLSNIAGMQLDDFCIWRDIPCFNKEEVATRVRHAAYDIIKKKGATFYAIGLAVQKICATILRDENSILTVSGLLEGEYGLSNICLSLPTLVNRQGRTKILSVPMSSEEKNELLHSAGVLKKTIQELDL